MIKVRGLEVKQKKGVPPAEGLTVGQALQKSGVTVRSGSTVTVNRVVTDMTALVADNSTIVVTPPVDNGGR